MYHMPLSDRAESQTLLVGHSPAVNRVDDPSLLPSSFFAK